MTQDEWKEHIGVGRRHPGLGVDASSIKAIAVHGEHHVAGFQHEHKDGRVDAIITPQSAHYTGRKNADGSVQILEAHQ